MTQVTLTNEDAIKFKAFQKHYDLFTIMEEAGVFNIGYGKAILNVAGGTIQNIIIEEVKWKR